MAKETPSADQRAKAKGLQMCVHCFKTAQEVFPRRKWEHRRAYLERINDILWGCTAYPFTDDQDYLRMQLIIHRDKWPKIREDRAYHNYFECESLLRQLHGLLQSTPTN